MFFLDVFKGGGVCTESMEVTTAWFCYATMSLGCSLVPRVVLLIGGSKGT